MYNKLFVLVSSMAISQFAFSANPIIIPEGDFLITDHKTGCKRINPSPKANESISYDGKCVGGYANGFGTTYWYKDGKEDGKENNYLEMGFPIATYDKGLIMTASVSSDGCKLLLPISTDSQELANLFTVKFHKSCSGSVQKDQKVDILFNNQHFGTFEGTIRRKSVPVGGKLTLFTGSVYQMGKDNGDYIIAQKFFKDWIGGVKRLEVADKGSSKYSENDFTIKLGLNSSLTESNVDTADLWLFNLEMDNTKNDVYLDYDIKPNHSIAARALRMNIQVTIDYRETTSMGWIGTDEAKQFNKVVSIDLPKSSNHTAKNKLKLTSFQTHLSSMGVDITLSRFKSKVEVLSIDEL